LDSLKNKAQQAITEGAEKAMAEGADKAQHADG